MTSITIKDLTFGYSSQTKILDGLNMSVPEGSIYGFLGGNGAGKSTTLRMILGLLKPQSGEIKVMGSRVVNGQYAYLSGLGALIESPSYYGNLNAIDNLKVICALQNKKADRLMPLLEKVGLADHAYKRVKNYSTGMKQRLGLAMALVHDPTLLILDEPVNGLDPSGMNEMRNLLLRLQKEGKTIILSSHILSELERIATHIGILNKGSLVFEGTLEELKELRNNQVSLIIRTKDIARAKEVLADYNVEERDQSTLHVKAQEDVHPYIIKLLVNSDVSINEARLLQDGLEDIFLNLTTPKE